MASFPGSVFAPASKSAGNTIASAHVNALDAEVVAIEDGFRNATAPLNSSASTVVALSVTGGSTFAGPVVFSSGVSFGANGSFTPPRVPSVKLTAGAATQIGSSATWVGVSWDTEVFDSAGAHSTTTNSSRIALNSSGMWMVGATLTAAGSAFLDIGMRVMLNDASALCAQNADAQASAVFSATASAIHVATSTSDYVTVQVQSVKSTGSISSHAAGAPATFWAYRVSA